MKRGDTLALAIILGVFVLMTAVSWQRWCNPVIDSGREMNQPLRLLRGERLYADVYHLYGPLSPYINVGLYKVFGAHLNTLYASGWSAGLLVVAMLYWIARTLMSAREAAVATLGIVVLCLFKQAGNYISPYSYAAVHGTVFDVATVLFLIQHIQTNKRRYVVLAGCCTGLAMACKSEFGIAAGGAGLILLTLRGLLDRTRGWRDLTRFLGPALLIIGLSYGIIFLYVPWTLVVQDTYLWLGRLPEELVYFNKVRLGLDDPLRALAEMGMAAGMLLGAGCLIAAASLYWTQGRGASADDIPREQYKTRIYVLFILASVGVLVGFYFGRLPLDRSPYRATPLILAGLMVYLGRRAIAAWSRRQATDARFWIVVLLAVHSLLIISRVVLRVPSGGAYGAYFLPTPTILLVYLAGEAFPAMLARIPNAALVARRITAALLVIGTIPLVVVTAYRYRREPYYKLETMRGTMRVPTAIGPAFRATLDFIAQNTQPDEPIFAAPEGSSLNFLADRRAPERYEILTPGFLTPAAEQDAIRRLQASRTRYVFILNRPTTEFGPRAFGRDYCTTLMGWIESHYHISRVFGETRSPAANIGIKKFFIKVYEHNDTAWAQP